jgi:hypothetical protein
MGKNEGEKSKCLKNQNRIHFWSFKGIKCLQKMPGYHVHCLVKAADKQHLYFYVIYDVLPSLIIMGADE